MRTQIIAARTVAEALAAMATSPEAEFGAARAAAFSGAPVPELAGPREENLASLARLVAARRGDQVRIEEVKGADPDSEAAADGSLLPGPHAKLAGPTFEEWLTTEPKPVRTGATSSWMDIIHRVAEGAGRVARGMR
jgi:hypothetical protein